MAIDISETAILSATKTLENENNITVFHSGVENIDEKFNTIFMLDIIEHVSDDSLILTQAYNKLNKGGYIIITVPSNKKEWGWDDKFYGHFRRYNREDIYLKLKQLNLKPIAIWDFTFPLFWIMRKIYLFVKRSPDEVLEKHTKAEKTLISSQRNAWDIPIISNLLSKGKIGWQWYYKFHYRFFKDKIEAGHEMIILARK